MCEILSVSGVRSYKVKLSLCASLCIHNARHKLQRLAWINSSSKSGLNIIARTRFLIWCVN